MNNDSFMSVCECVKVTSLSKTTLWRLRKAGQFPKPHSLSAGRTAFKRSEVMAWIASRPEKA